MYEYQDMLILVVTNGTMDTFGLGEWIASRSELNSLPLNFILLDMEFFK